MKDEILQYLDVNINTGIIRWKLTLCNRAIKGNIAGTNCNGYIRIGFKGQFFNAHHVIWRVVKGYWPKELDHKNRCKHDNKIYNLRETTRSQNAINVHKQKGISYCKRERAWRAYITVNGETIQLGYHRTIELAVVKRLAAERHYFKEFAR